MQARALHYVFKIGNRQASYDFFINTLKMKVLRHEEFEDGCKATCNGPYDGKWSKTMVGYGPESNHFVIELTYNYGIGSYKVGNDYNGIFIESDELFENLRGNHPLFNNGVLLQDPDGHSFYVLPGKRQPDPVSKVVVNVKNLNDSVLFWRDLCGMSVLETSDKHALLTFGDDQCKLELRTLEDGLLDRGTGFGRIAFACPTNRLSELEAKLKEANPNYIQTPLVSLDTPGKATVHVVILRDPNDHEICFVGEEAFVELSQVDPKADELLREQIQKDDSEDWYKQMKRSKPTAE